MKKDYLIFRVVLFLHHETLINIFKDFIYLFL